MRYVRYTVAALVALPLFASAASSTPTDILLAQIAALKSQIASLQEKSSVLPGVRVCSPPQRPLNKGDSGDDVVNLQIFLAQDPAIYPEGSVVGQYGPATERAVQRFQKKYGIVSSGTPVSTGYGSVGSRTLALLQKLWTCGGVVSAGWFNANVVDGVARFSAQASSSAPLDTSLYVDFGDGAKQNVSISTAVCKTLAGQCSSLMSTAHPYARGTFVATLRRPRTEQKCLVFPQTCVDGIGVCASLPPICSMQTTIETFATTTIISTGASASAMAGTDAAGGDQSGPPGIRVLAPTKGAAVLAGGSLTVSWSGSYAPQGSSVNVLLRDSSGAILGAVAKGQRTVGTYWWTLPQPSGAPCTADAFTCLTQLSTPSCTGDICNLSNGNYTVLVQLVSGNTVVASAESGTFTLTSAPLAVTIATGTSTSSGSTGSTGATSSAGVLGALPSGSGTPTIGASCIYSGIPYGNNITLQVSCTDLAGLSCGNFGTLALTCKNGTWVDGSGTAASVPNLTTPASSGASCTTPWGSTRVQSGQQITYEPFFTGGQYTGAKVVPLMQCTAGKWQKCNWDGTGCVAYTVVQ